MSSSVAIQAPLTATTTWGFVSEPFASTSWIVDAPCWWALDVYVAGKVFDTTMVTPFAPRAGDFLDAAQFAGKVPLHLQIDYKVLDCRHSASSVSHRRIIDANTGRYMFFGSSIEVKVLAPPSSLIYSPNAPAPELFRLPGGPTNLAALIDIGAQPLRTKNTEGRWVTQGPDGAARLPTFTWRQEYGGITTPEILVPNGALRCQVFDLTAGSPDWEWRQPTIGGIAIAGGQSSILNVPGVCALAPTTNARRSTAVVFEVML